MSRMASFEDVPMGAHFYDGDKRYVRTPLRVEEKGFSNAMRVWVEKPAGALFSSAYKVRIVERLSSPRTRRE